MNDIVSRLKLIRQMIGYYFLLLLCQIGGEVVVTMTMGDIPLDSSASNDLIAREMIKVLTEHPYLVLSVTYGILAFVLCFKKLRSKTVFVLVGGFKTRPGISILFWGAVMAAGGRLWSLVIIELISSGGGALDRLALSISEEITNQDPFWLEFIAVVVLASFFEELIFRGIIFSRARLLMKPVAAVVCQAIIFASMYSVDINMAIAIILGLVLGFAALQAESIWAPIVIRMVFNLTTFIADPYYDAIFTNKQTTIAVIIISGIVFALAGYFYFRNERDIPNGENPRSDFL